MMRLSKTYRLKITLGENFKIFQQFLFVHKNPKLEIQIAINSNLI